jgi:phosphonoacetate hydrolase
MVYRYTCPGTSQRAATYSESMPMRREKTLLILIDGFGPEYLHLSDMPNLRQLSAAGFYCEGKAVLPSVTNINNASVVTAAFPEVHGIVANFCFDAATGEHVPMENAEFLECPTLFEEAARQGRRAALVTAKDKVKTLLARGAVTAFSAEIPEPTIVDEIGPPPGIYTAEVNHWVFRAARSVLRRPDIDWLYVSTTDYMMHTYAPEHERSREHLHRLDQLLREVVDDHSQLRLGVTADHGMNAKTRGIDAARLLAAHGLAAEAVPIIRDKHVVHHGNLGGACYVYMKNPAHIAPAGAILQAEPGIEEIYDRAEAAERFRLRADRIGDWFLLGAIDTVFGELRSPREEVAVRSHGSRHEEQVPILLYGCGAREAAPEYSLEVTRALLNAEERSSSRSPRRPIVSEPEC